MTPERPSSTDPVVLPGWTWQPFLDDAVKALHPFDIEPYPVAEEFLQKQEQSGHDPNQSCHDCHVGLPN